jgi:hypothetical protein
VSGSELEEQLKICRQFFLFFLPSPTQSVSCMITLAKYQTKSHRGMRREQCSCSLGRLAGVASGVRVAGKGACLNNRNKLGRTKGGQDLLAVTFASTLPKRAIHGTPRCPSRNHHVEPAAIIHGAVQLECGLFSGQTQESSERVEPATAGVCVRACVCVCVMCCIAPSIRR